MSFVHIDLKSTVLSHPSFPSSHKMEYLMSHHEERDHHPALMARPEKPCTFCIIAFDVETEQSQFMPHPGDSCDSISDHKDMFLFDMKGQLCMGYVSVRSKSIKIWVLEDHRN
ncbi:hypothetical protein CDL15_Pgr013750 [Punica granatum]|uniref:Uncharacterized protein n=1 Tax=Punica granatum TaxID=22663 RepID=A0A218W1V8_PUNGR|nr:hypothetical protein CDL15_Pgr013750 [Punica granatum]